jgi:7-cyano-7-deazaguanine reductase
MVDGTLLGREVAYGGGYDPGLLTSIPRAAGRAELGLGATLPFHGVDIWNAYELTWLDPRGKPEVGLLELRVPADSPMLVESKSLKLYLMGYAMERIADAAALARTLAVDLSAAAGATVGVRITRPAEHRDERLGEPAGTLVDALPVDCDDYGPPNPSHLAAGGETVAETLVSQALMSNCPVTSQPDYATLAVSYRGPRIDPAGLLRYVVSFRRHSGFHEACVERIFVDLMRRCAPTELTVSARYTRRGGIDINPWRSTSPGAADNLRGVRQ